MPNLIGISLQNAIFWLWEQVLYTKLDAIALTSLPDIPRHSQAKLYPSELVTIGILFSLKGGFFRAFYRWLERDYGDWFGDGTLPERTRLQRLLKMHREWSDLLMAEPSYAVLPIFYSLKEAQVLIEMWRKQYNTIRPHSALEYRPPTPAAIFVQSAQIQPVALT